MRAGEGSDGDIERVYDNMGCMASWPEFALAAPRLAAQVRALFQQYGQGLGYLATVRPDGGPRVHPVAPVITEAGLFCFVIPSPKRRDLERDGRYALHSFPAEHTEDEAYLAGTAVPVADPGRIDELARRFRATSHADWRLFELGVEVAMLGRTGPAYQVWRDRRARPGDRLTGAVRLILDFRTPRPRSDEQPG
jgi:hypothetical protein